mmetsp:Transcript_20481/g.59826  ORF Transcript_20481/g.59826 Transcript_20481/m.59826 type:complete len:279 (+) Transcript_20481:227-1063(+)
MGSTRGRTPDTAGMPQVTRSTSSTSTTSSLGSWLWWKLHRTAGLRPPNSTTTTTTKSHAPWSGASSTPRGGIAFSIRVTRSSPVLGCGGNISNLPPALELPVGKKTQSTRKVGNLGLGTRQTVGNLWRSDQTMKMSCPGKSSRFLTSPSCETFDSAMPTERSEWPWLSRAQMWSNQDLHRLRPYSASVRQRTMTQPSSTGSLLWKVCCSGLPLAEKGRRLADGMSAMWSASQVIKTGGSSSPIRRKPWCQSWKLGEKSWSWTVSTKASVGKLCGRWTT